MLSRRPARLLSRYGTVFPIPKCFASTKSRSSLRSRSKFVISKDGVIRELPRTPRLPKSFENPLETVPIVVRSALAEYPRNLPVALTAVSALVNTGESSYRDTAYRLYFEISRASFSHKEPKKSEAKLLSILESMKAHGLPADEAFYVKLFDLVSREAVSSTLLSLFSYMKKSGVKATSLTALFFMRRFSRSSTYTRAFEIFDLIRSDPSFVLDADVLAELIYAGILSKDPSLAERAFEELQFSGILPNPSCYGQLVRATAESKDMSLFPTRFHQLQALCPPDKEAYRRMLIAALTANEWSLFSYIVSSNQFKNALDHHAPHRAKDKLPVTSPSLLGNVQSRDQLAQSLNNALSDQHRLHDNTWKLVDAYRETRAMSELHAVLNSIQAGDNVDRVYQRVMEVALAVNDEHFNIILDHMKNLSYKPPEKTLATLIDTCIVLEKPLSEILVHMNSFEEKTGQHFNSYTVYTSLLRYAGHGEVNDDFLKFLRLMDSRGIIVDPPHFVEYVARPLIQSGFADEAHQVLEEMRSLGCRPWNTAYQKLIVHYSNSGEINKAIQVYDELTKDLELSAASSIGPLLAGILKSTGAQKDQSLVARIKQLCIDINNTRVSVGIEVIENAVKYLQKHGEFEFVQDWWAQSKDEYLRRHPQSSARIAEQERRLFASLE